MALAVAVVMRTAFVGTAAGPPDFDQLRLGRRVGLGFSGGASAAAASARSRQQWLQVGAASLAAGSAAASGALAGSACATGALRRPELQRQAPLRLRQASGSGTAAGASLTGVTLGSSAPTARDRRRSADRPATSAAGVSDFRRCLRRASRRSPRPAAFLRQRSRQQLPAPASAAAAGACPCDSRARAGSRQNPRRPIRSARSSPASPQSRGRRTRRSGFSPGEVSRHASAGRIRSASRSRISTRTARSPHWR